MESISPANNAGMKAHIGVDSRSKIIHMVVATAANVAFGRPDCIRQTPPYSAVYKKALRMSQGACVQRPKSSVRNSRGVTMRVPP